MFGRRGGSCRVRPRSSAVLVIPDTAVIYAPYGDAVFTIEEKDKATHRPRTWLARSSVRLGEKRGDLVEVVTSGLSAGDTIVSSGAFKLHNGSAVVLHNELATPARSRASRPSPPTTSRPP